MKIKDITAYLEDIAPAQLQESYDNAGLITGNAEWECTGIMVSLDTTESVILEAVEKKCNLVIAHHPVIFGGLKKITGKSYVERTVIAAIKNNIAVFAIHTNLDNILSGVNGKMADRLGLVNRQVLLPKINTLKKLFVYVPITHAENIRQAVFAAGAGHIGNYSECSFTVPGEGTFKPGQGTAPYVGLAGQPHTEQEMKVEVIYPSWLEDSVVNAMRKAHPYEEVAYDMVTLNNTLPGIGSGLLGHLQQPVPEVEFMALLKKTFDLNLVKHTALMGKPVEKVAICGGSGSFLIKNALAAGADFYVTADIKYHEFFDAEERMVIADIGHYESEQYTISLLFDILKQKYPTFAVLKTEINTNPVKYFF